MRSRSSGLFVVSLLSACAHVQGDPAAYGEAARVRVANASVYTLCGIHMRPKGSFARGDDLLREGRRVRTGHSFDLELVPGTYHVTFLDCSGTPVLDQPAVELAGAVELLVYSDAPPGGDRPSQGRTRLALPTVGIGGGH
ncbi:MAG: hypothetical protein V3V08_11170 [Nannocystaceae bacterium]